MTIKTATPIKMNPFKTGNSGKAKPGFKTISSSSHSVDHGKKC